MVARGRAALDLVEFCSYAGMSIIPSMDTQVCAENSHNILCSITKDAENVAALDAIGIGDATDSSGVSTTSQFQRIILQFLIRAKQQRLHVHWS